MLKNKILLLFVTIFLATDLYASNSQFEVRELNYQNAQEIKEVCELFEDQDIQEMTGGKTKDNQMNDLSTRTQEDEQKYGKYFICKTIDGRQTICGILICTHSLEDSYAEYKAIGVHKNYRRQGIASLMMTHVEKIHIEQIPVKKILIGVFPNNKPAIKCYSKHGFYIPLMDKVQTYCRIAYAKLLNRSTSSIGFYMHKNL